MRLPRRRGGGLTALLCAALGALAAAAPAGAAPSPPVLGPVRHVAVGDLSVGYRRGGHGPALVMVMGRSATMADWDPRLLGELMEHHRIVVFDNRAVGTTSRGTLGTDVSIAQMATDAVGLVEALGIRRTDLLGWSMGGYIAQSVAVSRPDIVRRLILSATSPGGTHAVPPGPVVRRVLSGEVPSATLFALSFPPSRQGVRAEASYGAAVARAALRIRPRSQRRQSLRLDSFAKTLQLHATTLWKSPAGGVWNELAGLGVPTLVANGNLDVIERPGNGRRLARRIPGARHCVFRGTGHAFLFQDYALYGAVVNQFLAGRNLRPLALGQPDILCA